MIVWCKISSSSQVLTKLCKEYILLPNCISTGILVRLTNWYYVLPVHWEIFSFSVSDMNILLKFILLLKLVTFLCTIYGNYLYIYPFVFPHTLVFIQNALYVSHLYMSSLYLCTVDFVVLCGSWYRFGNLNPLYLFLN